MCLIIKKNQPIKKARHNITCYKVLNLFQNNEIRTPYSESKVPLDCLFFQKQFTPEFIPPVSQLQENYKHQTIGAGYIHTYAHRLPAIVLNKMSDSYIVYKCIIPKGTYYYEGKDDSGEKAYASLEIIFKKKQSNGR